MKTRGLVVRPNTIRNYRERFYRNISPEIGNKKLIDVRPIECQNILNQMVEEYAGSTIYQALTTMGTIFKAAVDNEFLKKTPVNGTVKLPEPIDNKVRFLTIEEQQLF